MRSFHAAAFAFLAMGVSAAGAATVVPVPHFGQIALHGGGHVVVKHGAEQRVTLLKGSTQYTRFSVGNGDHLFIYACNERCPARYDLDIEIVTPALNSASIGGGGDIVIEGGFPAQELFAVAIDGGGDIDARAIEARQVSAAVNGGGSIKVKPRASLVAAVNGGGEILYGGSPAVTRVVKGGGSVEPLK